MLKKIIVYNLFIFFCLNSFGQSERRSKILNIIREELGEVEKISKQAGGNNPNLLLKKAELLLERGRLQLESENEKYLSLDPQIRAKSSRNSYFVTSRRTFQDAKVVCQKIIRDYPGYEYIGDVYFILAYYSKELGDYKSALVNFNKARVSTKNENVRLKSEIAMAEIFYTVNKCEKSNKLYQSAIPKVDDKWKSKDLYNYGWCLYKTGQADKAIEALRESHRLSQKPSYIDMGSRVEKDIIIFYVSANRLSEGLDFINKKGRDKDQAIQELVKRLKDGGEFDKAEKLLLRLTKQGSDEEKTLYYLMLYRLYEGLDWKKSSKLALILKKQKLNSSQFVEARKLSLKKMAYLQNLLIKNRSKNILTKKQMAQGLEAHALLAVSGDETQDYKVFFAVAEGCTVAEAKKQAFNYYMKSLALAKKLKKPKLQKMSLDGAFKVVSVNDSDDLITVYRQYLNYSPKGAKSASIYEKLFQVYLKKNEVTKAENLLKEYQRNFPQNISKQEGMLALLLEQYKKQGKTAEVKSLIGLINSGGFRVSSSYKSKLTLLSNSLTEKEAAGLIRTGNWQEAIKKYELAFASNTSKEIKADIALNIAQLYDTQKQPKSMITWLGKTIDLMNNKQIRNSEKLLSDLIQSAFYNAFMAESFELSQKSWRKSCRSMTLFKTTIVISRAYMDNKKAGQLFSQARKCLPANELNQLALAYREDIGNESSSLDRKEQAKLSVMKRIQLNLNRISFSSDIISLNSQVKRALSELAKLNNQLSLIKNDSTEKILGFQGLVQSYGLVEVKIKKVTQTTKSVEIRESLVPVVQTLNTQKKAVFKRALGLISKNKNYTSYNHGFLKFLNIASDKTEFRTSL